MTISAISIYRGGASDEIAPLAGALEALYRKYGVGYRLSRFDTGPNKGDWLAFVTYVNEAAYQQAQERFAEDSELQQVFRDIAKLATRVSREMITDMKL